MVVVAFAINPSSLHRVLLLLLSIAYLEHLFNKQGLKPGQTRLTAWDESTAACGGVHCCQKIQPRGRHHPSSSFFRFFSAFCHGRGVDVPPSPPTPHLSPRSA